MPLTLNTEPLSWPTREPFALSRGTKTSTHTLLVTLVDAEGRRGRGEAAGIPYHGETPDRLMHDVEAVRREIESGIDRESLLELMPPGGARNAIDCALWDLEAKQTGISVLVRAGIAHARSIQTAYSIGIRSRDAYMRAAARHAAFAFLKIKVDGNDPLLAVEAVHRGAPSAKLIVDPNQSWSVEQLKRLAPDLTALGVVLIEQPIPVGDETALIGYNCPIMLCADELIGDRRDLPRARGAFGAVNIKLDKTGGLTEALALVEEARTAGFTLMVGCMGGSSLCVAPGYVVAQSCAYADLDGPLLSASDWPEAVAYDNGVMSPPRSELWG